MSLDEKAAMQELGIQHNLSLLSSLPYLQAYEIRQNLVDA